MSPDPQVDQRVRALRGATTAAANTPEAIHDATVELVGEMLHRNDATPGDVVSMVFTATPDLTAEFPATAARSMGLSHVPLLCAQELAVGGALEACIRVLMHFYTAHGSDTLRHVYLRGATELRTDLMR